MYKNETTLTHEIVGRYVDMGLRGD